MRVILRRHSFWRDSSHSEHQVQQPHSAFAMEFVSSLAKETTTTAVLLAMVSDQSEFEFDWTES
jgi:hypothetical protein